MILANKILNLRKKMDWSQEELADKLKVSRQSISKWESALSIPDMNRIIQLSELFGVSVDYLVKDDRDETKDSIVQTDKPNQMLSLDEIDRYLKSNKSFGRFVGYSVALCILSPVILLFSIALIEKGSSTNDQRSLAIGVAWMLGLLALAAGLAIYSSLHNKENRKLETHEFELAYGTKGILKERQKTFESQSISTFTLSIVLMIVSVLPVTFVSIQGFEDYKIISMVALMLIIVAAAVLWMIRVSFEKRGYEFLLSEGEFEPKKRKRSLLIKQLLSFAFVGALIIKLILSIIF